jgi:hypothetical protein
MPRRIGFNVMLDLYLDTPDQQEAQEIAGALLQSLSHPKLLDGHALTDMGFMTGPIAIQCDDDGAIVSIGDCRETTERIRETLARMNRTERNTQ